MSFVLKLAAIFGQFAAPIVRQLWELWQKPSKTRYVGTDQDVEKELANSVTDRNGDPVDGLRRPESREDHAGPEGQLSRH